MEALIRWKHPERGSQPNDFIPLLEETGLIIDVGKWVLHTACRQGAKWRQDGHPIGMAVNVSARQLDTDEFVADVTDALSDSGLDTNALTLEITETTLMRNVEETSSVCAPSRSSACALRSTTSGRDTHPSPTSSGFRSTP
jgi:diguanylate cyclase